MPKIKVKDIALRAAELLNLEETAWAIESGEDGSEIGSIVACVNTAAHELATEYAPLIEEEEITSVGKNGFELLSKRPHEILEVIKNGVKEGFSVYPAYFTAPVGTVTVKYTFIPERANLSGEVICAERVTDRLVALGAAREYCLIKGLYDEAETFETHYVSALRGALSANKKHVVKPRRWV